MIFLTFLENLNQLNVFAIIKKTRQEILVKVDENGFICVNHFRFHVKCVHLIKLNPLAVYRVSTKLIDGYYHLNYLIKSVNFIRNDLVKSGDHIPISYEILNDWIFCHNHNQQKSDKPQSIEIFNNSQNKSSKLSKISQIISIINSESIGSRILFESDVKKQSLLVKIINPFCLIGFKKELNGLIVNEICLKSAAHLEYQLLNNEDDLEELKNVRFRFDVSWYLVENESFQQFYQSLLQSNKEEIQPFQVITSPLTNQYSAYLSLLD